MDMDVKHAFYLHENRANKMHAKHPSTDLKASMVTASKMCKQSNLLIISTKESKFSQQPLKSVKMGIPRALLDQYVQEWNVKVNVSSKGKQYLLSKDNLNFEMYLINASKFYYSKINNIGQQSSAPR